jgi:hypothetical protein
MNFQHGATPPQAGTEIIERIGTAPHTSCSPAAPGWKVTRKRKTITHIRQTKTHQHLLNRNTSI